ncbi:hypothetical protein BDL97_05G144800 [Sphagnum fallax]|nr:hypothetical protein BDL97_05G144800 [Sphagnum fallax]
MNRLNGSIPYTLGSNSILYQFDVSSNFLTGPIPPTLCTGEKLWRLILFDNFFSDEFPELYGNCKSLIRLRVSGNQFVGAFPEGLWSLPRLSLLEIYDNFFEGSIPASIGNATSLTSVKLYNNTISGSLPRELGRLQQLDSFYASRNNLSGSIPEELGDYGSSLTSLYLDTNSIRGPIPASIGNLSKLVYLSLAMNQLEGPLPAQIAKLDGLIYLDVSRNLLSGDFPDALGRMALSNFIAFNFSDNNMSGILPDSILQSQFASEFVGNPHLCTTNSLLIHSANISQACSKFVSSNSTIRFRREKNRASFRLHMLILTGVIGVLLLTLSVVAVVTALVQQQPRCFFFIFFSSGKNNSFMKFSSSGTSYQSMDHEWNVISFHPKLQIRNEDILECLDEDNVIGSGGGGKVYKGTLGKGKALVAVKQLWGRGNRGNTALHDHGFKAEVETLGKIRHRNIVKLLCCCSRLDSNLLVYEYMPNGSLGDLLHTTKGAKLLDWSMRYKIAVGAAQGLAYLHHDCVPRILHRDVKSKNILLDADYEAHVADFGLAKSLQEDHMSMQSAVAGTYGYIAPGNVSCFIENISMLVQISVYV